MDQENTKPGPGGMKGSWRDRLGINKELPKISEEFKPAPQKPAPSDNPEPAMEKVAAPRPPGTPIAKPAPMAPRPNAAELGDRLRQQREAAERMAEQRVAEAKERAVQAPRPAPPSLSGGTPPGNIRPRFTFADDELRNARPEPAAPRESPTRHWSPGQVQGSHPTRPVFTADRQGHNDPRLRNTAVPPRQAGSAAPPYPRSQSLPPQRVPPSYPPGSPPGGQDRKWQPRPPRQTPPPGYDPYRRDIGAEAARQLEDPHVEADPYQRQERQPEPARPRTDFRGAHSRELAHVDEEPDDLFEDDAQPRRRATAQEYSQAYREYENGYEQQEPRRRTGPLLLITALIAVGAIAGGLIYLYQKSTSSASTEANVPVVAEPTEPVKTEPEPATTAEDSDQATQQQSMAPSPEMQAPSQRKQIYDRILGETTLEEQEQIVPSEEQPVAPRSNPAQGFDADPLPLPMPPPPGEATQDQSGSIETPVQSQSTAASTKSAAENVSQQASPAAASLENQPSSAKEAPLPTEPPQASAEPAVPNPEAKAAKPQPKIESGLASAKQPVSSAPAAGGSGPIQIAQLPASDSPSAATTFSGVPQSLPDPAPGSSPTAKRRAVSGRASDKVIGNSVGNFNRAKPVEVAQIEPAPITTQSIAEPAIEPAPEPQPVQQQAALPAAPAQTPPSPGAGSGFVIQLASYKTEADALAGYERLRQQHGTVIGGLTPNVQMADLGAGGTFYRLDLGAFSSRQAAKKACSSLLAAGERDCLVKAR